MNNYKFFYFGIGSGRYFCFYSKYVCDCSGFVCWKMVVRLYVLFGVWFY